MMIISLTAGLAACGGSAGEGSQAAAKDAGVQRYAWPLGSSSPEDTVTQIYAEKFADEVDRLSDGKMKISVYQTVYWAETESFSSHARMEIYLL